MRFNFRGGREASIAFYRRRRARKAIASGLPRRRRRVYQDEEGICRCARCGSECTGEYHSQLPHNYWTLPNIEIDDGMHRLKSTFVVKIKMEHITCPYYCTFDLCRECAHDVRRMLYLAHCSTPTYLGADEKHYYIVFPFTPDALEHYEENKDLLWWQIDF